MLSTYYKHVFSSDFLKNSKFLLKKQKFFEPKFLGKKKKKKNNVEKRVHLISNKLNILVYITFIYSIKQNKQKLIYYIKKQKQNKIDY